MTCRGLGDVARRVLPVPDFAVLGLDEAIDDTLDQAHPAAGLRRTLELLQEQAGASWERSSGGCESESRQSGSGYRPPPGCQLSRSHTSNDGGFRRRLALDGSSYISLLHECRSARIVWGGLLSGLKGRLEVLLKGTKTLDLVAGRALIAFADEERLIAAPDKSGE